MNKSNITFIIKLITYTIVICIITVVSTLFINKLIIYNSQSTPNEVNPGKLNEKSLKSRFDEFIAYGSGYTNTYFTVNLLL